MLTKKINGNSKWMKTKLLHDKVARRNFLYKCSYFLTKYTFQPMSELWGNRLKNP